jgi:uncharacterized protein YjiS (DUF1127 family)
MSTVFKSPPGTFVRYEDLQLCKVGTTTTRLESGGEKREQNCKGSADRDASSVLLRDDHIVLLAIDALLALHAALKKWRKHRRTLRVLADLDERQLRDIGLTRDNKRYRRLAELDDTQSKVNGETK